MTERQIYIPGEHQRKIIDFGLNHKRAGIWAGMGMGKTSSTLSIIDARTLAGELTAPTLVLAPLRVARSTWPRESLKWAHLRNISAVSITGDIKQRTEALSALQGDSVNVFTMNYENLPWLREALGGKRWPFQMVVSDESTRLKSFRLRQGGKRAAALRDVAFMSDYFIELTGTPAPNGLVDLWGQLWFIDRGERLGRTYKAFEDRFFRQVRRRPQDQYYELVPYDESEDEIHRLVSDICISLRPEDYFDIDKTIIRRVEVDLPPQARKHYRELERQFFTEIGDQSVEAPTAAARSGKALQVASGAVWASGEEKTWAEIHDAKLQALESIIEEAAGMPVLVAYHWKHDLIRLKKSFPRGRELDNDPQTEDDWNAGKIPLLFVHPQSAGHGLNLQDGGNIIAFFSEWWDLETYLQVIERIGPVRQQQAGHPRSVFEYHIIARDTLDEEVYLRRTSKRSVQDCLMEAVKCRAQTQR